ncbi:5'-Nucleotidase domain-containing protein [Cyanobacterium stanieri PCC 7202]|uniref:5'-Nucleotidase domain-containing protein n=1 Tax=Cyanobacterium stanieri (strain ATCC 29140 / PCC 7202) TaxID=292563 RepID=K9YJP4_CYASC|nr:5'-Nucleotidase domain-containing protein [Cyanobacterium stanieri PCC 7202]
MTINFSLFNRDFFAETLTEATDSPSFTLQLFHFADQEAGTPAFDDIPRFSAVLNALRNQDLDGDGIPGFANTLTLSSGDAYIPGLFFGASEDVFGGFGRGDILIQNELGVQAIALGNHEFDLGTALVRDLIIGDGTFGGTNFPYLSSNLDFSTDANLADLVVADGQAPQPNSIAASVVFDVNGEQIGVVGATTPILRSISSPGNVGVFPSVFSANPTEEQLDALAAEIQADVDALIASNTSLNKIILLAHMQQLSIELELAQRLRDVDIIVAGGSNTRLFDENDRPRAGDTVQGPYPIFGTDADGNPIAVVNTDGNYKYVGRLVIDFDENGFIIPESYDPLVSGAFATDEQGVADLGAQDLVNPEIQNIVNQLREVVVAQEGNFFGISDVFLNGSRGSVRTEETNLGNLTADANLAIAKETDPSVVISIKNGGGIRDNIGRTFIPTGSIGDVQFLPTEEVVDANGNIVKPQGGISQNDIANALSFNNGLTLVTVTAQQLLDILEHAVSASAAGATPGQFPQVSGVAFSFDINQPPGDRIRSAVIQDENGQTIDVVVANGQLQGQGDRTFRLVTLGFLADGGDGYPFPQGEAVNRVDLAQNDDAPRTGNATFAPDGTEQDALAEFLFNNFLETPFNEQDTSPVEDTRIQNLAFRNDSLIPTNSMAINLNLIGNYRTGIFGESAAEIPAYDPITQRLFVVNAQSASVDVLDMSDPTNPTKIGEIIGENVGGIVNSVTVKNGIVAVAVEANVKTDPGSIILFSSNRDFSSFIQPENILPAGSLPDAITFTPDGTKILVSNEGEPNDDYTIDPEGSVTIIDVSNGIPNAMVTQVNFNAFDDRLEELRASGVRIFGPGATVSQDLEPEWIAVSSDSKIGYVSLQENNAIAILDIENGVILDIKPLGFRNHSLPGNGLDVSDRDNAINIANWPVFGIPQPDSIATYAVGGRQFVVTANEGDARDYDGFSEEVRVNSIILDPVAFPNASELQQNSQLGRLSITNTLGISDRAIFVSELTGEQQVEPSVTTDAQGSALTWVDDNGFLNIELTVSGLDFGRETGNFLSSDTGDDVILLHIHEGARGANGGVVWDILEDPDTIINVDNNGVATITSIWQENTIAKTPQGEDAPFYFNIHTERNQAGEIRGQIVGEIGYDEIYAYGSRSFSIYDQDLNLIFDSADQFEQLIAQHIAVGALPFEAFNANNSENDSFDSRSDNKGPEPEGIAIGEIDGVPYAFVGLERIGGVMVYDISNPNNPQFIQYLNNRDFGVEAQLPDGSTNPAVGDLGAEGLIFIDAQDSPNGEPLLVVANEVSGTTSIFEIQPFAPVFDLSQNPEDITVRADDDILSRTDASFHNIVGLYRVENSRGAVLDTFDLNNNGSTTDFLNPGDQGYAFTAIANAVSNFNLELGAEGDINKNTTAGAFGDVLLEGGQIYAPFIIANGGNLIPDGGTVQDAFNAFLDLNPNNVGATIENFESHIVAYFSFLGANPDNSLHVRNYGNNIFGFEDLPGNLGVSDFDFNDALVRFTPIA